MGRGIQKICAACENLGAEEPEYIVHGEDIMVKFRAPQSAKVIETVVTESEEKVPEILRENPAVVYLEIAIRLKISRMTVSQKIKCLKDEEVIVRVGPAKKGYWKCI